MKYIWNNSEYTQDEIDAAVAANNTTLDQYLVDNGIEKKDDEEEKKEKIGDFPTDPGITSGELEVGEEVVLEKPGLAQTTPPAASDTESGDLDSEPSSSDVIEVNEENEFLGELPKPTGIFSKLKPQVKFEDLIITDFYENPDKVKKALSQYPNIDGFTPVSEMSDDNVIQFFKSMGLEDEQFYKDNNGKWQYFTLGGLQEFVGHIRSNQTTKISKITNQADPTAVLNQQEQTKIDKLETERENTQSYLEHKQDADNITIEIDALTKQLETVTDPQEVAEINKKIEELQEEQNEIYNDLNLQIASPLYTEQSSQYTLYRPIMAMEKGGGFVPRIDLSNKHTVNYAPFQGYEENLPTVTTPEFPYLLISQEQEDELVDQAADFYQKNVANAFENTNPGFDFLNNKAHYYDENNNYIEYDYKNLFKIEDFKQAPLEIVKNLREAPPEVLWDLFNIPMYSKKDGPYIQHSAADLQTTQRPYKSAELFNELFGAFGFYAYYDEDEDGGRTTGLINIKGESKVRIYYRPEFEMLENKDGEPMSISELDKIKGMAIPKGDFAYLYVTNENPRTSKFLEHGPLAELQIDAGLYADNSYVAWDRVASDSNPFSKASMITMMGEFTRSLPQLFDFMEMSVDADIKDGKPYFDTDALDVTRAPSLPKVKAKQDQADIALNHVKQTEKAIEIEEENIKVIVDKMKNVTPVIDNRNREIQALQEDQEYNGYVNQVNAVYNDAKPIIQRLNEIADIINKADKPLPSWYITNPITGEELADEYARLDNQLKGIQEGIEPLLKNIRAKEKDYNSANKKYNKLEKRIQRKEDVDLETYVQQNFAEAKEINKRFNNLYSTKLKYSQQFDNSVDALNSAEVEYGKWAKATAGRGNFGSYTWNRIFSNTTGMLKGLYTMKTDIQELFAKNYDVNYDPEYYDQLREDFKRGAEARYNQVFKKHDIDAFYTSNFEATKFGEVYGVALDMITDMTIGHLMMPFAPGAGFALSSTGRILDGVDSELDRLEELARYQTDAQGNFVYGEDGNRIELPGWQDKVLSQEEKVMYKSLIGTGTAILERIGLSSLGKVGTSKVSQAILGKVLSKIPNKLKLNPFKYKKLFEDEIKNLIAKGAFVTTVSTGGEVLTEVSQEYWQEYSKDLVNGWRDTDKVKFFSDPDYFGEEMDRRVARIAEITTYATLPFSLVTKGASSIATQSRVNTNKKEIAQALNLVSDANVKNNTLKNLALLKKNNQLNQQQYDQQVQYIQQMEGIAQSFPKDANGNVLISSKAQTDIAYIQSQIISLKNNKSEDVATSNKTNELIKQKEEEIKLIIDEDIANGGMKAELAQDFIADQEQKRRQTKIDAIRQKNLQKAIDKQGNIVIDAANQNRINEEVRKIEEETGIKLDPSQYELSPENKENFKVIVFTEENSAQIAAEYGLDADQLLDENGKFKSEGIYLPTQGVILMDVNAAEGVLQHEGVHNLLDIALNKKGNENVVFGLARALMSEMIKIDPRTALAINRQLEKYDADPNYNAAAVAEELLTYYAQMKSRGLFNKPSNRFLSAIARQGRRLFENLGVPIELNRQNVMQFLDDYLYSLEQGGRFTKAQEAVMRGDIEFMQDLREDAEIGAEIAEQEDLDNAEQTEVVEVDENVVPAVEAKDIKETLDEFTGPAEDLKYTTQNDFKNSIDYFNALEAMTSPDSRLLDASIKNIAARKGVDNINLDDVKQRLYEKYLGIGKREIKLKEGEVRGYDPSRNSLFGWLLGKNGNLEFAVLDVIEEAVAQPSGVSLDAEVFEGGPTFEQADTSVNIIEDIDKKAKAPVAPRSQTRRQIILEGEQGLSPELVKGLKEEVIEVEKTLLPADDAKYRADLEKKAGRGLKPFLAKAFNIGNKANYEQFLEDNYNLINQLDIKYLLDLDKGLAKQGKPRMFTRLNKKLTTQEEIRKYKDSGDVYVENEAQGVNLYDRLDFSLQDVKDFYLNQTASNITNRKGKLIEAFGSKFFKDFLPQIQRESEVKPRERATTAAKIQRDQRLLFAKKFDTDLVEMAQLPDKRAIAKKLKYLSPAINESNRAAQQKLMEEAAEKGLIDQAVIEAGKMGSGGRQTFYGNFKDGKFVKDPKSNKKWIKSKKEGYILFAEKNKDGKFELVNKEQVSEFTDYVAKPGRLYYGDTDPAYQELMKKAKPYNGEVSYTDSKGNTKTTKGGRINPPKGGRFTEEYLSRPEIKAKQEANMNKLDHVVKTLAAGVQKGLPMEVAGLVVVQSYQASDGLIKISAPFKYISDVFEQGDKKDKSNKLFREEHNPPASVVGASILLGIRANKPTTIMDYVKENFYQTQLSKKDDTLLDNSFPSTLPPGVGIGSNPIIRMSEAGINLNTVKNILTGKSIIEEYGLGVPENVSKIPNVYKFQNKLIKAIELEGKDLKTAKKELDIYVKDLAQTQQQATDITANELQESKVLYVEAKDMDIDELLSKAAGIDEALKRANMLDQPVRKIRIFDFDDTLATSNNIVIATRGDETIELNAEEFAQRGLQLKEEGYEMDFSDFNRVTDGGRGPLFEVAKAIKNARGNEDLYVLTARAPQAQDAIYEFLKQEGLEFKKENIVGLGNSTGEAKANWIIDKASEGFNDFYFADDAYQNVKAVQDALAVIDVKSKVQQAKIKESKQLDEEFNSLLQQTTGVEAYKEYSAAKAKTVGSSKGNFKFFIPYSAEDFMGLIYPTLGKGTIGDAQMAWYKQNLLDPYTKAQENISAARINLMNDFKALKKQLNIPKNLRKTNDSGFTNEQAVRVYLFDQQGHKIPGMSKRDLKELTDIVKNDPQLQLFADQILTLTKGDGYVAPGKDWLVGTITTDLIELINTVKRPKYLAEWQQRVDIIYSEKNLNKLEALYGTKYREALENILARMKSGKNRMTTGNRLSNRILDYINGSIGTIMFFNTRSAVLQTISSANFINWSFNNPIKAGAAFANQPQYWKDFKTLMNSDYLRDRRNGLKLNISESEIADAAKTSKNKAKAVLNYILQKGYLPTQFADSFAIASGGATYYRNRVNHLIKTEGMTQAEAEAQALIDWRQIAEESQQSSDPSRISQQQASDIGRLVLAFANTPMQYARLQKRAIQDLINGRGDAKSNVSKIAYYGFVQNMIFNALQQGVFALGFGDDEDDESKQDRYYDTANGMLDSLLRGLGIGGQAVSVGKNFLLDIYERSGRSRPEYVDSIYKLLQFSPPINSKISKLRQAAWMFDSKKRRQEMFDKGFNIDNPAYDAFAKVISSTTNLPLDRLLYKIDNIRGALDEDNDLWQRIAMLGGWPKWQLEPRKTFTTTKKTGIDKRRKIKLGGKTRIKRRKIKLK